MQFKHGQIVATPGALVLAENGVNLWEYLELHLSGDWGDLDQGLVIKAGSKTHYGVQSLNFWILANSINRRIIF